jgi:uncharacterized protein (TIGR02391 family)
MAKQRLDPRLLAKLAKKTGKSAKYLREQISRRSGRQGISSEAALVLWCRRAGIGATTFLNKQPTFVRDEVRTSASSSSATTMYDHAEKAQSRTKNSRRKPGFGPVVDVVLEDQQLRDRCRDLLTARKNFDRAFREATTVFDDRLKKVSGIQKMNPQDLIGKALNPDPQKAVLEVSTERQEQEGFYSMCKGIMLTFRNRTHHSLSDKMTRQDAIKFCGFVDSLLAILGQATTHPERVSG